jgi:hypothetical protein
MASAVCAPPTFPLRRITRCPNCKQRRRFSGYDALWYGPTWTCCACGDSWGDGERLPRSNRHGWRVEAAAKAKRVWDEAGQFNRADHSRWVHEQLADCKPAPAP